MANMNIRTPRFYPDLISHLISRGVTIGTVQTGTSLEGLSTGTASEIFDLRPLNQVVFRTSRATSNHVLTNFVFPVATYKVNYVAILNHNLTSSKGKIRIFAGDHSNDIETFDATEADVGDINWQTAGMSVLNGTTSLGASNESLVIEPSHDGTTIIRFNEQSLQYWAVQFEGANGASGGSATDETWDGSTDFKLGGIMIGEFYNMPNSPDLNVKRTISYDNNKVTESLGGQKYGHMINLGRTATSGSKSPFTTASNNYQVHGGRIQYDMSFSYLNSTDIMPDEYHIRQSTDDNFISDVWNITDGNHRPFIFNVDSDSTGTGFESEHIFARFDQNKLDMSQVAPDVFNMKLKIEEEF